MTHSDETMDRALDKIDELRRIAWMALGTAAVSVLLNIVLFLLLLSMSEGAS